MGEFRSDIRICVDVALQGSISLWSLIWQGRFFCTESQPVTMLVFYFFENPVLFSPGVSITGFDSFWSGILFHLMPNARKSAIAVAPTGTNYICTTESLADEMQNQAIQDIQRL